MSLKLGDLHLKFYKSYANRHLHNFKGNNQKRANKFWNAAKKQFPESQDFINYINNCINKFDLEAQQNTHKSSLLSYFSKVNIIFICYFFATLTFIGFLNLKKQTF